MLASLYNFPHPFSETPCGVCEVGKSHGNEGLENSTKREDELDFDVSPNYTCHE